MYTQEQNGGVYRKPVRSEVLDEQLTKLLAQFALSDRWAVELGRMTDEVEREEQAESDKALADLRTKAARLSEKLQRLLDTYLDEIIERDVYLAKKAEIMSEKKSLEEQMSDAAVGQNGWVEPMRNWLERRFLSVASLNLTILQPKRHSCAKSSG